MFGFRIISGDKLKEYESLQDRQLATVNSLKDLRERVVKTERDIYPTIYKIGEAINMAHQKGIIATRLYIHPYYLEAMQRDRELKKMFKGRSLEDAIGLRIIPDRSIWPWYVK